MRKTLSIFFIGQMLVIMYIFNTVLYPAICIQNIYDGYKCYYCSILTGNATSSITSVDNIYKDLIYEALTSSYKCMLITNSSNDSGHISLDIYKNTTDKTHFDSISANYEIQYHELTKAYFDSSFDKSSFSNITYANNSIEFLNAVNPNYTLFKNNIYNASEKIIYTDADIDFLNKIDFNIHFTEQKINYFNLNNMSNFHIATLIILCIISFIVMLLYTATNNKEYKAAQMMGISKIKIILSKFKIFSIIQLIATITSIIILTVYSLLSHHFNMWCLLIYVCSGIIITVFNFLLLFLSQFVISDRTFSIKLSYCLTITKITLVFVLSIFLYLVSQPLKDYYSIKKEINSSKELDKYKYVNSLSDDFKKTTASMKNLNVAYDNAKKLYNKLNDDGTLMFFYSAMFDTLNKTSLYASDSCIYDPYFPPKTTLRYVEPINDKAEKDRYTNSYKNNYVLINTNYAKNFINVHDLNGNPITFDTKPEKPYLLIPKEYKSKENSITDYYMNFVNSNYYNYCNNEFLLYYCDLYENFKYYDELNPERLTNMDFTYIDDFDMDNIVCDSAYPVHTLHNPIIVILDGNFDNEFYLNTLLSQEMFLSTCDDTTSNDLSNDFAKYNICNNTKFSSLTSTQKKYVTGKNFEIEWIYVTIILFISVLIFLIPASVYANYKAKYTALTIKYILGYSLFNSLKFEFLLDGLLIICSVFASFVIKLNFIPFVLFVTSDIICTLIMYKKFIASDNVFACKNI